jgi:TrmH family RNA methyltransferase
VRISSAHNPTIKYVRSLGRAAIRHADGVYVAEGVRLVSEALATAQPAALVLYDRDSLGRTELGTALLRALPGWADRTVEVDARVLAAAAQTETPAGVLAVLRLPQPPPLTALSRCRFGLVLDRLGDPGNVGTILRSAAAFGLDYAVALPGTVDLFSPKVVRAAMGAHFRLPLYVGLEPAQLRSELRGVTMVAADIDRGEPVDRFAWPEEMALIIGSEANGLSPAAEATVAHYVHIPMRTGVESLNAAVAASIVLYVAQQGIRSASERYT